MAGYGVGGGGATRVLKAICVAFMLVISVWFLFMGIVASKEIEGRTAATSTSVGNHKHTKLLGRKRHSVPVKLSPVYASKRRVPSGPDPIHNRHIGETRKPPGRA
ncbi:hypothetical protein SOVF_209510 [Spinacia oleracea]|nr:hypothetical protein SOVF_209510 [Spinacia oleracea]